MNLEKRERLIERCGELDLFGGGGAPKIIPLVPFEEFFDGAEGDAGILCNVPAAPDDDAVLTLLREIQSRPEVSDVCIAITQVEDDCWPFSDTIVIVASTTPETVSSWFPDDMAPDECSAETGDHFEHQALNIPEGSQAIWLWFD